MRREGRSGWAVKLFLVVILMALSCSCTAAPTCSDEKTVRLVKEIYQEALTEQASMGFYMKEQRDAAVKRAAAFPTSVVGVTTTGYDKKVGRYTCGATMEVRLPDSIAKLEDKPTFRSQFQLDLLSLRGVEMHGGMLKAGVEYTSQLTDDKRHAVQLQGHVPLANLAAALGSLYQGMQRQEKEGQEQTSKGQEAEQRLEQSKTVPTTGAFLCKAGDPSALPIIEYVSPDSPAALEGMQVGDAIIERNGEKVSRYGDLASLAPIKIGDTVKYEVLRNGERFVFRVKVISGYDLFKNWQRRQKS